MHDYTGDEDDVVREIDADARLISDHLRGRLTDAKELELFRRMENDDDFLTKVGLALLQRLPRDRRQPMSQEELTFSWQQFCWRARIPHARLLGLV
ncbi:MAG: hypothetical protein ACREOK_00430 [Gemmatimonadaceae bacterium]